MAAPRPLTASQRTALDHLARGCLNKEIAAFMGISEAGAKKHLEHLRRRYGVTNRVGVVRAALECGDLRIGKG